MTRVIAIVAAYNEADVIEATTRDLIEQGVEVYLLDNGSTDGTADAVRHLVGHGVIAIETFAPGGQVFELRRLMARKQVLAATLSADWFINHDADELRESPWRGLALPHALSLVDRLGFNAVDFAVLNFPPVDGTYRTGDDLRRAFPYFEPGARHDAVQIRCWKQQPSVDLEFVGGHDVQFPGRRVFPIRFLLRHYPIRSQAHGERKVFEERIPRFDPEERKLSWHVQYNSLEPGVRFVRDPASLTPFDPDLVRAGLAIAHRDIEAEVARRRELEASVAGLTTENARLTQRLDAAAQERQALADEVSSAERRMHEFHASLSWRITAPLRWLYDRLRGV